MDRNEIRAKLVPIFQRYTESEEAALLAGGPLEDMVDSMTFLEIMFDVEDKFGISIGNEDMKEIRTFDDVVAGIEVLLARQG